MRTGAVNFISVLSHFYGVPWAILPAKLAELRAVLWRRIESGAVELSDQEIAAIRRRNPNRNPNAAPVAFEDNAPSVIPQSDAPLYKLVGAVALIRIGGVITARASIFDDWSGGVSNETIGRATDAAVADGKAEAIIYDIESPGGTVQGLPENADKVLAAKKTKPTKAVANHYAASAAYWYASQAAELYVTPAGQVGAIGVLMNAVDETEALKMAGVKDILVSNEGSPYKAEGYPQVPFTEAERADMQEKCNKIAQAFFATVAKGRGLKAATVESQFGRGRMVLAQESVDLRMTDGISTLQEVVDSVNRPKSRAARRNVAAQMVAYKLPTS